MGIFAALTLVYLAIRIFIQVTLYGQDDLGCSSLVVAMAILLSLIGGAFCLLVFCMSLYVFIGFKAGKLLLPPDDEFDRYFIPFMWTAFAAQFVGNIFFLGLYSYFDFFVIDLDDEPSGFWRRLAVVNRWARLSIFRTCNVTFQLITVAFLVQGFDLMRLAARIPSMRLIDMGSDSLVMRMAVISVLWFLTMLVQFLWAHFVQNGLWGNPFIEFIETCKKLRISVYMRVSPFFGYFVQSRLDLTEEYVAGGIGKSGLEERTFTTFFAADVRSEFNELLSSAAAEVGDAALHQPHFAGDAKNANETAYRKVNAFLRDLFDERTFDLAIQRESLMQQVLGLSPTVISTSVLTSTVPMRLQDFGLGGCEWNLLLLYLTVFVCLDSVTRSPGISGIVVYVIDAVFVRIYKSIVRANLARKGLLDDRLYI
jgi:hypothetical protein